MRLSLDAPSRHQAPFFETRTRLAALTVILFALYLGLAILTLRTNRPDVDDAAFANPSYNLIFNGFMGTTIYGEFGLERHFLRQGIHLPSRPANHGRRCSLATGAC